jgi:predicted glycosyltransferase involved in capsule biosynthesis
MIDLSDTTFLIPLRYDSRARKENAERVVRYLLSQFKTTIMICEESDRKRFSYLAGYGCRYFFIPSGSPFFHRTKCLNRLAVSCSTEIFCSYDCDVLLAPEQCLDAVESIRRDEKSAVFPYDGRFYDVPAGFESRIMDSLILDPLSTSKCRLLNRFSLGGALFWKKSHFFSGGMYNENFLGWGYEDKELVERFTKIGYEIGRVDGPLFHLSHPRKSVDSFNPLLKILGYARYPILRRNKREFRKIKNMGPDELQALIRGWEWTGCGGQNIRRPDSG